MTESGRNLAALRAPARVPIGPIKEPPRPFRRSRAGFGAARALDPCSRSTRMSLHPVEVSSDGEGQPGSGRRLPALSSPKTPITAQQDPSPAQQNATQNGPRKLRRPPAAPARSSEPRRGRAAVFEPGSDFGVLLGEFREPERAIDESCVGRNEFAFTRKTAIGPMIFITLLSGAGNPATCARQPESRSRRKVRATIPARAQRLPPQSGFRCRTS